jgi:rubredoxin
MVSTENKPETAFKVWTCILCGFCYDEAEGLPASNIPPGTRWADVPDDFVCPECSATKVDFEMVEI